MQKKIAQLLVLYTVAVGTYKVVKFLVDTKSKVRGKSVPSYDKLLEAGKGVVMESKNVLNELFDQKTSRAKA